LGTARVRVYAAEGLASVDARLTVHHLIPERRAKRNGDSYRGARELRRGSLNLA
jgi:hypothetical protein